jgi:hypothetical protein
MSEDDATTKRMAAAAKRYIAEVEGSGISGLPLNIQRDEWRERASWLYALAEEKRGRLTQIEEIVMDRAPSRVYILGPVGPGL